MPKKKLLRALVWAACLAGISALPAAFALEGDDGREAGKAPVIWGTWYVALDTTPYGLPGGALPALLTIHRDGTWILYDGLDFGGIPIGLVQSPMFGAWTWKGDAFEATTLYFAGDPALGETSLISRGRFRFRLEDGRLVGTVNGDLLLCPAAGPTPFVTLNCPNAITSPDWMPDPGSVPDVPWQAWRLVPLSP